ncbi:hypothetical protein JXB12_13030 [candidate division KSB1 bacterium]|nr:hypothetical protein [candidate division KSB1 bacterium]
MGKRKEKNTIQVYPTLPQNVYNEIRLMYPNLRDGSAIVQLLNDYKKLKEERDKLMIALLEKNHRDFLSTSNNS